MKLQLPQNAAYIIRRLEDAGFESYAVGGCIRDTLLGKMPEDWDITTSALPEQIKAVFPRTVDTGIEHGTVTVLCGKESFEVTTYRIDGEYEDARHPKEVVFTASLTEDLKRRDFTINAMAYNEKTGLVDCFSGLSDLNSGIIRCVGEAEKRFDEDALRMMRAVRFAAQLGFIIEENTYAAIKNMAGNLAKVSAERIQTELVKLLQSKHAEHMRTLYETGITAVVLPEFDRMMETPQNNPHHCYTVGEHTLHALEEVPEDKVLRLAMLFHDVAKPACRTTDRRGVDHFRGHPQQGEKMTSQILRRLKFDNDTRKKVCAYVKWHDYKPWLSERNIRFAASRIGTEYYPGMFVVKRADIKAQSKFEREQKLAYVDEYEKIYRGIMERQDCLTLKGLKVNGSDLIAEGMRPGKEIGEALQYLLEQVLEQPELNDRDTLLSLFRKHIF
ncbi:MAG: CCA tRNA nucleotidyltransferase [Eubacterium sp.]|nr:CCA tRNA nucleotidyltransferase [Eubacterium sp.]